MLPFGTGTDVYSLNLMQKVRLHVYVYTNALTLRQIMVAQHMQLARVSSQMSSYV